MLEVIQSRRDRASSDDGSTVADAALSLDISDTVMSADLVSILIAALTTTAPCEYCCRSFPRRKPTVYPRPSLRTKKILLSSVLCSFKFSIITV